MPTAGWSRDSVWQNPGRLPGGGNLRPDLKDEAILSAEGRVCPGSRGDEPGKEGTLVSSVWLEQRRLPGGDALLSTLLKEAERDW